MEENSEVVRRLEKISEQLEEIGVLKEQIIKVMSLYSDLIKAEPEPLKTELLTSKETAKYLKIALGTLYHLRAKGAIKSYKTGKFVKYKVSDLDAYLLGKASTTSQEIANAANDYCLRKPRK